jgi:hypothetical protein
LSHEIHKLRENSFVAWPTEAQNLSRGRGNPNWPETSQWSDPQAVICVVAGTVAAKSHRHDYD